MPLSGLVASRKQPKQLVADSPTLQGDVSADRVRLLAALGAGACGSRRGYEPADEALREALNIASQLSDPKLEARLLGARSIVNFQFFRLREAAADGLPSEQLGWIGSCLPGSASCSCEFCIRHYSILGAWKRRLRIADELEPLAKKIGQSLSIALCLSTRAWMEFGKAPDLAKLEADLQRVSKI